ncbi:MAG: energy transducer TonB [Myxococcales bacterium]|nr:energy transducer TonB [Myxococcales bacterium]MCB9737051.1 energy transducer TonB [Deltaproteobacteria bacterium]
MLGALALRHVVAALVAVAGVAGVLALMLLLNDLTEAPKAAAATAETSFEVERKPPPRRERRPERQREVRKTPERKAPPAPVPQVASAVSAVDVGLGGLGGLDLGASAKDLLGDSTPDRQVGPMSASAVDVKPRCRLVSQLEYPRAAQAKGVEGKVVLSVLVDERGEVRRAEVQSASPPGVFDGVATAARFACEPGQYQGQPVSVWVRIPLDFTLR